MTIKKKQIIFLEPWPTVMVYKIAKLFKKKGYETISIRILESKGLSNKFFGQAFDKILSFNLIFHKINLKNLPLIILSLLKRFPFILKAGISILRLKPYIIVARAQPSWPCKLIKILFKKHPMIYFPYDLRAESASEEYLDKIETKGFELKAEEFCFKNSEGIMHKGDPDELKPINPKPPQIHFPPYCSKDFIVPINKNKLSKKDKKIHIVHIDSAGFVDSEVYTTFLKYIKAFIRNKIHIHLYTKPNTSSKEELHEGLKKVFREAFDSKYFHLHLPLDAQDLAKEMSKYDFGLFHTGSENISDAGLRCTIGNKLSSYLEAGIPFFYTKKFAYVDKIMKSYGLALYIENVKDINKIKYNPSAYKKLEKKIIKARQDFLMEKNFPKLEKFIKKIVEKKKRR